MATKISKPSKHKLIIDDVQEFVMSKVMSSTLSSDFSDVIKTKYYGKNNSQSVFEKELQDFHWNMSNCYSSFDSEVTKKEKINTKLKVTMT